MENLLKKNASTCIGELGEPEKKVKGSD